MKAYIAKQYDLENEIVDIVLILECPETRVSWIKGYDDVDWEEADKFAGELAKILNCKYLGEYYEEYTEDEN